MEDKAIILDNKTAFKMLSRLDKLEALLRDLVNKGKKEYLTHKEAQQLLKVSRNTVDAYVELGYFKRYQSGGKGSKITFKRSEIEKFIENNGR